MSHFFIADAKAGAERRSLSRIKQDRQPIKGNHARPSGVADADMATVGNRIYTVAAPTGDETQRMEPLPAKNAGSIVQGTSLSYFPGKRLTGRLPRMGENDASVNIGGSVFHSVLEKEYRIISSITNPIAPLAVDRWTSRTALHVAAYNQTAIFQSKGMIFRQQSQEPDEVGKPLHGMSRDLNPLIGVKTQAGMQTPARTKADSRRIVAEHDEASVHTKADPRRIMVEHDEASPHTKADPRQIMAEHDQVSAHTKTDHRQIMTEHDQVSAHTKADPRRTMAEHDEASPYTKADPRKIMAEHEQVLAHVKTDRQTIMGEHARPIGTVVTDAKSGSGEIYRQSETKVQTGGRALPFEVLSEKKAESFRRGANLSDFLFMRRIGRFSRMEENRSSAEHISTVFHSILEKDYSTFSIITNPLPPVTVNRWIREATFLAATYDQKANFSIGMVFRQPTRNLTENGQLSLEMPRAFMPLTGAQNETGNRMPTRAKTDRQPAAGEYKRPVGTVVAETKSIIDGNYRQSEKAPLASGRLQPNQELLAKNAGSVARGASLSYSPSMRLIGRLSRIGKSLVATEPVRTIFHSILEKEYSTISAITNSMASATADRWISRTAPDAAAYEQKSNYPVGMNFLQLVSKPSESGKLPFGISRVLMLQMGVQDGMGKWAQTRSKTDRQPIVGAPKQPIGMLNADMKSGSDEINRQSQTAVMVNGRPQENQEPFGESAGSFTKGPNQPYYPAVRLIGRLSQMREEKDHQQQGFFKSLTDFTLHGGKSRAAAGQVIYRQNPQITQLRTVNRPGKDTVINAATTRQDTYPTKNSFHLLRSANWPGRVSAFINDVAWRDVAPGINQIRLLRTVNWRGRTLTLRSSTANSEVYTADIAGTQSDVKAVPFIVKATRQNQWWTNVHEQIIVQRHQNTSNLNRINQMKERPVQRLKNGIPQSHMMTFYKRIFEKSGSDFAESSGIENRQNTTMTYFFDTADGLESRLIQQVPIDTAALQADGGQSAIIYKKPIILPLQQRPAEGGGEDVFASQMAKTLPSVAQNKAWSYERSQTQSMPATGRSLGAEEEERLMDIFLNEFNYDRVAGKLLDKMERKLRAERRKFGL